MTVSTSTLLKAGVATSGARPTLRQGSDGPPVIDLQRLLAAAGFDPGGTDGNFGLMTDRAVRSFQSSRHLSADGVVGPQTWDHLDEVTAQPSQPAAGAWGPARAISLEQCRAIMPKLSAARANECLAHLNRAMHEFSIDTRLRHAAFLAQLAHESGELRYFQELASGEAYEGRKDLGNTQPGDGKRYKGRGPIQLTGRNNYRLAGAALGLDLEADPVRAADLDVGFRIAGWYWAGHGLNALADVGDFREITRRINGGYTHYEERLAYYERALAVL